MNHPATSIAVEFAHHLVAGRFEQARLLLAKDTMTDYSVEELAYNFSILGQYDGGKLTEVQAMDGLDDWPTKNIDDICSFYIALSGRSARGEGWICEAVAGILKNESESIRIHSLEWGRP
jgi:hypothetical protein